MAMIDWVIFGITFCILLVLCLLIEKLNRKRVKPPLQAALYRQWEIQLSETEQILVPYDPRKSSSADLKWRAMKGASPSERKDRIFLQKICEALDLYIIFISKRESIKAISGLAECLYRTIIEWLRSQNGLLTSKDMNFLHVLNGLCYCKSSIVSNWFNHLETWSSKFFQATYCKKALTPQELTQFTKFALGFLHSLKFDCDDLEKFLNMRYPIHTSLGREIHPSIGEPPAGEPQLNYARCGQIG